MIEADIQNGPTHENQPAFKWSDYNFDAAHEGQPDEFNFDWVTVKPDFGHNH